MFSFTARFNLRFPRQPVVEASTTTNTNIKLSIFSHQLGHEVGLIDVASPDLKVWLPWTNVLSLLVCVNRWSKAPDFYVGDLKGGVLKDGR